MAAGLSGCFNGRGMVRSGWRSEVRSGANSMSIQKTPVPRKKRGQGQGRGRGQALQVRVLQGSRLHQPVPCTLLSALRSTGATEQGGRIMD